VAAPRRSARHLREVTAESIFSVLTLTGAIWAGHFLLGKARREHDRFGEVVAVLTALAALFAWLFFGVRAH
jgi:hypothetical protein